ncbi:MULTISPECIES: arginase family protein [unclassified Legionella]|uniref:arginase family protein n=1 Tax=unclassified Legionella TaxID=2622702 RepID=UPI0013EF9D27|nr:MULTISPECIES: arginase family protein [unclassified Legionella]MDI9819652.1 arginase family protein [Legionella sp. PL877]
MKEVSCTKGFLGLTSKEVTTSAAKRVLIIPFGFEYEEDSGCRQGPQAIIAASQGMNLFDERLGCYPYQQINIKTIKAIPPGKRVRQAIQLMQQWQDSLWQQGQFALILGGEHRLMPDILSPLFTNGEELAFIHLGAQGTILHELALKHPRLQLLGLGLRNIDQRFYQLAQREKDRLRLYYAHNKATWDWQSINDFLRKKRVYLSISVNFFDMSLLPATPSPEPGGLMWDESMACIDALASIINPVGACLCDFSPLEHVLSYDLLVAKFVYRLLTSLFVRSGC